MKEADLERAREMLLEAFTAGWQAALARNVTTPGARAVVEGCFDLWLRETVDEVEVLGLAFRRRADLPGPASGMMLTSTGLRLAKEEEEEAETAPARQIPAQRPQPADRAARRRRPFPSERRT